jgi:8-oxo-dGTP pyrophosphatase MutT (NUDIX family)
VLVREQPGALDVYLVKRSQRSGFWPSAHVFPGGRVDDDDASSAHAAIRECFEECGVLLACHNDDPISYDAHAVVTAQVQDGDGFWTTMAAHQLRPDLLSLIALSRWVTPVAEGKRYDTQFFAARVPTWQRDHAGADGHEVTSGLWISASAALDMALRGDMVLAPPTVATLEDMAGCDSWSSLQACRWPTLPIEPVLVQHEDQIIIALPGDRDHPDSNCIFGGRTRLTSIANGPFRSGWNPSKNRTDPQ